MATKIPIVIGSTGEYQQLQSGDSLIAPRNLVSISSNYSVLTTDAILLVDTTSGTVTVTLPSPTSLKGYMFSIKKIVAANSLIINTVSGNIDGGSSATVTVNNVSLDFITDGTNYFIV
jgi:hypothetical protein